MAKIITKFIIIKAITVTGDEGSFDELKRKWSGGDTLSVSRNKERMSLMEKIKNVLLNPLTFFERIKREEEIVKALKYLTILSYLW